MLVIEIGLSLLVQPRQLSIHIPALPLLVARFHEEQHRHAQNQNARARRQVQTISDRVVWPIEGQERPGRNKTSDVAEHDVRSDCGGARSICKDIRRNLGVAQGAEGEGACGDEEGGAVADLGVFGGEEHDVADHHQGGGADEEDLAFVEAGGEVGEEHCEEGADDVGWDGAELLVHYRVDGRGVDRLCGVVS
jgi:hypothetical protein